MTRGNGLNSSPSQPDEEFPSRTSPALIRKPRILGLETEYAVLYQPDEPGDSRVPPFTLVETVLFNVFLEGHKVARSLGIKGGYFLENGGLVHLEIYMHEQADTPILELCTPECSNSRDLLVYQRAFDELLTSASDRSWKALVKHGYRGRIIFGKNNLDSRSVGYGCHENYLVWYHPRWFEKLLVVVSSPLLLALSLPWFILFLSLVFVFFLAVGLLFLCFLVVYLFRLLSARLVQAVTSWGRRLVNRFPRRILGLIRHGYIVVTNFCLYPVILGFTTLLKLVAFRPHFRNLTGFLVTRQIMTGSGWLNPASGRFELSQRAPLTTSLAKIIMVGRRKTMFDLKGFLYRPLSLFQSHRKLTICSGDSNLSDSPNYLKIGITTLILDMIEAGVDFSDLEPRRPVRSFRDVSTGGPWKEIDLGRSGRKTAIEIQREYLRRAREFFCGGALSTGEHSRIIDLWEETLGQIADEPRALSSRLDWAAKKALLDRAILSESNWKTLAIWAGLFHRVDPDLLSSASSLEDLVSGRGILARWRLRRKLRSLDLDPEEFSGMRDLYFQCLKVDLRYHEISSDPGYQRQLEMDDLIERRTDDEEVSRATHEPPPDTRARLRSYYIKLNTSFSRKSVQASWEKVIVANSLKAISLADPFYSRVPTD